MIYKKIGKEDIHQIQELELITFKENSYSISEIENFNESENFLFVITKIMGIIIGYAIIYVSIDEIEIYKICVSNLYKRKKIGSKIIDKIKTLNKNIIIEVSDRDFTKNFYEKNKFKLINFRKNYYHDNSNALIMKWQP